MTVFTTLFFFVNFFEFLFSCEFFFSLLFFSFSLCFFSVSSLSFVPSSNSLFLSFSYFVLSYLLTFCLFLFVLLSFVLFLSFLSFLLFVCFSSFFLLRTRSSSIVLRFDSAVRSSTGLFWHSYSAFQNAEWVVSVRCCWCSFPSSLRSSRFEGSFSTRINGNIAQSTPSAFGRDGRVIFAGTRKQRRSQLWQTWYVEERVRVVSP